MTNEEAVEILKGAIKKPNTKDGYLGQSLDMAIKALEQIDKTKNILKVGVAQVTRDSFNEDFENFSLGDIKDEMWELYTLLYKIDCVLKDKSESEE